MGKQVGSILDKIFANQSRQSQTVSEQTSRPLRDEGEHSLYMMKLWVVMSETYGHKWTSPMGEKPNQTWTTSLHEMSDEQWVRGISKLKQSTDEWPPSLPEFRRWCIGGMTKDELKVHAQAEAERLMAEKVSRYNPNVVPMNYEQVEREQSRLARQIFVQSEVNERREAMGVEHITDPRRICQDEEYN